MSTLRAIVTSGIMIVAASDQLLDNQQDSTVYGNPSYNPSRGDPRFDHLRSRQPSRMLLGHEATAALSNLTEVQREALETAFAAQFHKFLRLVGSTNEKLSTEQLGQVLALKLGKVNDGAVKDMVPKNRKFENPEANQSITKDQFVELMIAELSAADVQAIFAK